MIIKYIVKIEGKFTHILNMPKFNSLILQCNSVLFPLAIANIHWNVNHVDV